MTVCGSHVLIAPHTSVPLPTSDPQIPPCPSTKPKPRLLKVKMSYAHVPPTRGFTSALLTITSTSRFRHRAAKLKSREEHIRESWVKAMEARIVRDNLSKCQRIEGVNHYEKCKDLAERYTDMLKENRVRVPIPLPPPTSTSTLGFKSLSFAWIYADSLGF